jgi:hypothetical protein
MLESDNNTLFILGEKTICKDEGRPKVELTWAKIFRTTGDV